MPLAIADLGFNRRHLPVCAQEWTDDRLTWDPAKYGNLSNIIVTPENLWLPELAVMNGFVSLNHQCFAFNFRECTALVFRLTH